VLRAPAARRLVGVRLLGQGADGVLQAALASLVLLSPERAATPAAVAAGSAVLLLPFTLVGPWAAGLVDRLPRRRVLVGASAVRAVLAAATAAAVLAAPGAVVAVLALAYLSVNRLLLAALSASLPRVVAVRDLVAANAVVPTAGSAAAFGGGALALAARPLLGSGDAGDARLLLAAAVGCALAGLVARALAPGSLGPDAAEVARSPRHPAADLAGALAHLRARPTAARALALVALHRLGYGVLLVTALLLARNRLAADLAGAAALVGGVLAASGAGFALAAAATPAGVRRWGRVRWACACCALAAVAPLAVLAAPRAGVLVVAAGVLGAAAQGVKVAVDTIVQTGVDDAHRGRVFVLYDVLFNASLVAAAGLAALVLPDDGWSPPLLAALALWWLALAVGYRRAER